MIKQILIAYRVHYSSAKTPMKDREYRLTFDGPVGTKSEWQNWAKAHNVIVKFKELTEKQMKSIKAVLNRGLF